MLKLRLDAQALTLYGLEVMLVQAVEAFKHGGQYYTMAKGGVAVRYHIEEEGKGVVTTEDLDQQKVYRGKQMTATVHVFPYGMAWRVQYTVRLNDEGDSRLITSSDEQYLNPVIAHDVFTFFCASGEEIAIAEEV